MTNARVPLAAPGRLVECARSTRYVETTSAALNLIPFVESFPTLAEADGGVGQLRTLVLRLAIRGRLVPRAEGDGRARAILSAQDQKKAKKSESRNAAVETAATDDGATRSFAIPDGWVWSTLADLHDPALPISYGVLVPGPEVPSGVPFVRIQDLNPTSPPAQPAKRIAASVALEYARTTLRGGEILIGVVGSIGKIGIAPASWAGANIARAVCRIAPHPNIDPAYLLLSLQAPDLQEYSEHNSNAGAADA